MSNNKQQKKEILKQYYSTTVNYQKGYCKT